ARSKATVLIYGESGTGKELLAHLIHQYSPRKREPFIAVNCAALPDGLLESELFGYEKGAFTGAVAQKKGKFELANHGTILLDEISELPFILQAKLLRILQEEEIDRVGGSKPFAIDVRVIATTNKDLSKEVHENRFREDLFYRLNVIPITLPSLRERKKDIPILTDFFLKRFAQENGFEPCEILDETLQLLLKYNWKGNIRELENVIERAVLLSKGEPLLPKYLFMEEKIMENEDDTTSPIKYGVSVKEMERCLIFQTLKEVEGNRTKAAKVLGLSIRTLRNKLREYREEGAKNIPISSFE
ncbi:MAG: sigma-54 dependent transcriptional regulator, partial [Thermodesulfobacteriota bacterium]|nr:sigma-54 dependent transcriptional regulator [Thermodesulfobacteriota bacterium]